MAGNIEEAMKLKNVYALAAVLLVSQFAAGEEAPKTERAAVIREWDGQYGELSQIIKQRGFLYRPNLDLIYNKGGTQKYRRELGSMIEPDPLLAARGVGNDDRKRALDPEAYWHPTDTDPLQMVLRRTHALLKHLQAYPGWKGDSNELLKEWTRLDVLSRDAKENKQALFLSVCKLRRRLMLSHPLLKFESIVFSNSGDQKNCIDHFMNQGSDGDGIWVVKDFTSTNPKVESLTSDWVVENGSCKDMKIAGKSLRGLELSFDGKRLLFSWRPTPRGKNTEFWKSDRSWHLFEAKIGETSVRQLTDGAFMDMDPCYLPGGRIAFVSHRRDPKRLGIHLRCISREPDVWTLHSCAADGSDIVTMSYHDIPEYAPSVGNDGRLVFTRWDYYDKASHWTAGLWATTPDGRDPRALFGNEFYPHQTYDRSLPNGKGTGLGNPQFLQGIRAIPGQRSQYIATVSAVHGGEMGTLILVDTSIPDDYGVGQIKRLTPELPFPESEFATMNFTLGPNLYGYPWPLSRDLYLVSHQGDICVLDRFGNRELLVARSEAPTVRRGGLVTPIPLRPRPTPPVISVQTFEGKRNKLPHKPATIGILNVYDSDYPLPKGVNIKWVRIIQFFPKHNDLAGGTQGPLGYAANADYGDTNNTRMPLGVVPVEKDGSAYFLAPIRRAIYFQLLDENGMAVHSMRSATHVQAGEQLTCVGCHEDRQKASGARSVRPMALRRAPSKPVTEVPTGAVPFNFYALVKPAFKRTCLPCHQKNKDENKKTGPLDCSHGGWKKIAWCNTAPRSIGGLWCMGSRTIPMHYGAHASILGKTLLNPTHTEARKKGLISEEDFRRMVLWLDCNSAQFGSIYSKDHVARQKKGQLVNPLLDFDPSNPLGLEIMGHDDAARTPARGEERQDDKGVIGVSP
jgi:hypothetical protein